LTSFAKASAVKPLGDGRYEISIDPDWFGVGPNGGVLAATILRALAAHVDDPVRHPLSLTCHFLTRLTAGAAVVTVKIERAGRGVTALSARLEQADTTGVLALATFGVEREGVIDFDSPAPSVPPPEDVAPGPIPQRTLPMFHRLEYRPCIGPPPFSGATEALVGGWSRLRDHEPLDEPALAMLADAWPPSAWARLTEPALSPTIDMTFHFRARINPGTEWALVRMHSLTSRYGFWEEDGELWAPDGTLLMQSRQLALLRPVPS
jgi:acyl-CoA thioesterase